VIKLQANAIPTLTERLIAVATYASTGLVGFVWMIYAAFTKKIIRPFLMYHIMLSIFISLAYYIAFNLLILIGNILSWIPFIRAIAGKLFILLNISIVGHFSVLQLFTTSVLAYLMITAFCGKYSYLPWFSDVIKSFFRR